MAAIFEQEMRGAQGIDHPVVRGAGHFLQEDAGEELAKYIVDFLVIDDDLGRSVSLFTCASAGELLTYR